MVEIPETGPFKAFIGNLPNDALQTDIECILKNAGMTDTQISSFNIHLVRDRETDKFKGFSYVQFNTPEELRMVLDLNGVPYDGRPLKIDLATARSNDRRGGGRGGPSRGDHHGGRGGGDRGHFGRTGPPDRNGFREVGGAGGNRRGGHVRRTSERRSDDVEDTAAPSADAPQRPRLQLAPRTTDPAELEAKKKREAEEEAKRRAKLFGEA